MIDLLNCNWDKASFLIFSQNVYDPMIYYSHLLPLISSIILGLFVFFSNRKLLINKLFLILTLLFSTWVYFDLILWATGTIEYEMFFWAIMIPLEFLIFTTAFVLTKKFISIGRIGIFYKILFWVLFLPILLLTHSKYNLTAFDFTNCDRAAIEGPLITYLYIIEGVIFVLTLIEIIYSLIKDKDKAHRIKTAIFSSGIITFMGLFIIGNVTLIQDMGWGYEQYKLFGMVGFLLILVFLIVRFKAFNIKLIGTQALIWTLIILIGSQFFFIKTTVNMILTAITLLITVITGIMLVKSVKKEVEQKEQLEIANQNQSALIRFITHQVKGFFTKSKAIFAGLRDGDYGEINPTVKELVQEGLKSDNQAVEMIQDILKAASLKSGKIDLHFESTDLVPLVKEIADSLTETAKEKGLELKVNIPVESVCVSVDKMQFSQVVKNLIDNSIRYTEKGSVTVSLDTLNPRIKKLSPKAIITVKDTGIGLSEADRKVLFTEGGRGEESLKMNVNSTGYGLYIVKKIVDSHQGTITAHSAGRNHGSTFVVELDLVK